MASITEIDAVIGDWERSTIDYNLSPRHWRIFNWHNNSTTLFAFSVFGSVRKNDSYTSYVARR